MKRTLLFAAAVAAACVFAPTLAAAKTKTAAKVPAWAAHREVEYPSARYIVAEGEGATVKEAENHALSRISLFFNTTTEVSNDMLRQYNELDSGGAYSFSGRTGVVERAHVGSQAEFFGVRFAEPYAARGKSHALAYIDRDEAFRVYEADVAQNSALIESLLSVAESRSNPIAAYRCARSACGIAQFTENLVKNALIVRPKGSATLSAVAPLAERARAALPLCRSRCGFSVRVGNDRQGVVGASLSKALESMGYSGADSGGFTVAAEISAELTGGGKNRFVAPTMTVGAVSEDGTRFFSWSRSIPKVGSRSEDDAYRRAYLALCREIESSFAEEFESRTGADIAGD